MTAINRFLVGLLGCASALSAADASGKWVSAPLYLILKQEGSKLTGTAGPSEKDQLLTFDNGAVDGGVERRGVTPGGENADAFHVC